MQTLLDPLDGRGKARAGTVNQTQRRKSCPTRKRAANQLHTHSLKPVPPVASQPRQAIASRRVSGGGASRLGMCIQKNNEDTAWLRNFFRRLRTNTKCACRQVPMGVS
jgi:hypothetical protein